MSLDFIADMGLFEFIFLCLSLICITVVIVTFFRIFWKK